MMSSKGIASRAGNGEEDAATAAVAAPCMLRAACAKAEPASPAVRSCREACAPRGENKPTLTRELVTPRAAPLEIEAAAACDTSTGAGKLTLELAPADPNPAAAAAPAALERAIASSASLISLRTAGAHLPELMRKAASLSTEGYANRC